MVEQLTAANFHETVDSSSLPVLVDCFATWCGPCKLVAPVVEKISDELAGKLNVYKVDVDEAPQVAQEYGIMSIPTLLMFKEGKLVDQVVGAMGFDPLLSKVQSVLG